MLLEKNHNTLIKQMCIQSGLVDDISSSLMAQLSMNTFEYIQMNENGEFIYLNNSSSYFNRLVQCNLFESVVDQILNLELKPGWDFQGLVEMDDLGVVNDVYRQFYMFNMLYWISCRKINGIIHVEIARFSSAINPQSFISTCLNNIKIIDTFMNKFFLRMYELSMRVKIPLSSFTQKHKNYLNDIYCQKQASTQYEADDELRKTREKNCKSLLTDRECKIIKLALDGETADDIAKKLYLSRRTIEKDFAELNDKFDCKSKIQLIGKLNKIGILDSII